MLRITKKKQRSVTVQLWGTESRIRETRQRVYHTQARLQVCRARLMTTRERLDETRSRLRKQNSLLSGRIADMYSGERLSYVNVLLNSSDIWTLLSRAYYVEQIIAADVRLIQDIEETKQELERQESLQRAQEAQVTSLERALKSQHREQSILAGQQRRQLSRIEQTRELYERALAELERESRRIEAEIRSYQRTPAGAKRMARKFVGGLSSPVAGRLTSQFGYRMHPILHRRIFHGGVDIAAKSGTPIHAAAEGTVMEARWRGGYGNTVVIQHDGGVSTLYAHCSSILVRAGQEVRRGQVIARVGSTGLSTGPHLHFERRQNGVRVNPL